MLMCEEKYLKQVSINEQTYIFCELNRVYGLVFLKKINMKKVWFSQIKIGIF